MDESHQFQVLIIDDDWVDRAAVKRALMSGNIAVDVTEAESCAAALKLVETRRFDCIYLDYNLPDSSGLSLLDELRSTRPDVPVVMLTGHGNEQIAVQAMKAGATDYVVKDLPPDAILQSLRSALRVRQAELERRRAEAALRESEQRFRLLVEGAKDYAMFLIDANGRISTWNSGAERIFGYTQAEITGRYFGIIFEEEDQDWHIPQDMLRAAEENGRTEETNWHVRKDGSKFWGEGTLIPVADEFGTSRGFEMIMRDATERKRVEEALAEAKAKQFAFLRDVLASVTDGRLILCQSTADLPNALAPFERPIFLTSADSIAAVRHIAESAAEAQGFPADRTQDLLTAVGEAAMNAVIHAGGGRAQVCVGDNGNVQVWIEDDGLGIGMEALPLATLQRGYTTASTLGYGFKLLLQTVDRIWLMTGPTGTVVALEQDGQRPDPLVMFPG